MRLGVASFILLVAAGVFLFLNVWVALAAFVASIVVQLIARKRLTKHQLPSRR